MLKKIFVTFYLFLLPYISISEELITPIPLTIKYDKNKVILGKKLFQDPLLSRDGTISCEHCHDLDSGGDDGLQFSVGIDGKVGVLNSPTVFNSRFSIAQFWDGRAKDLKEQAQGPIHSDIEMGIKSKKDLVQRVSNIEEYKKLFYKLYKEITYETIIDAIAEFEKALVTPNSRFDRYLRGEKNILTEEEKKGYEHFKSLGCISCHNGVLLGGNFYQKVGIFEVYNQRNNLGRYNVTKLEEDKYYFKVPMLRNISKTAPYFHDGSIQTLQETIQIMAYYQLGRELEREKQELIYKFLLTLDGEKPRILDEE